MLAHLASPSGDARRLLSRFSLSKPRLIQLPLNVATQSLTQHTLRERLMSTAKRAYPTRSYVRDRQPLTVDHRTGNRTPCSAPLSTPKREAPPLAPNSPAHTLVAGQGCPAPHTPRTASTTRGRAPKDLTYNL